MPNVFILVYVAVVAGAVALGILISKTLPQHWPSLLILAMSVLIPTALFALFQYLFTGSAW